MHTIQQVAPPVEPALIPAGSDGPSRVDAPRGPSGPTGPDNRTPPPRRRWGRWLIGVLLALLLIVLLASAALLWAMSSERGSRWLWQGVVAVMGGKLAGDWRGGSFAHGIDVNDIRYIDGATRVTVSHLDGRWSLALQPLHLTIDRLHAGEVSLAFAPSPPSNKPMAMPQSLRLPLGVTLGDVRVDKVSMGTLVLGDIRLEGRSDGKQHTLRLAHLGTPYGEAVADLSLAGTAPFALHGNLGLQSNAGQLPVSLQANLSGSLAALMVDLTATGEKLNGTAHVEAAPFGAVPLSRAQISLAHLNPRDFAEGAPQADVGVQADLRPVPGADALRVLGPVTVTNAKPGAIDAGLLPMQSLRTEVLLDATRQALTGIELKLMGGATLTGGGDIHREHDATLGGFALTMHDLDLRTLMARLPATRMTGPLNVKLDAEGQRIVMDWRDGGHRVQADVALDAKGTTVHGVSLEAGQGRVSVTGSLDNDDKGAYRAQLKLSRFDPGAWYDMYGPQKRGQKVPVASVTGQLDAEGALRPELGLTLKFALQDSVYADLPMRGAGTVKVAGSRLLPSDADLQVAGNHVQLHGNFGAAGDRLAVKVDAPALDRLGFGLAGRLQVDGTLSGTVERPAVLATLSADKLVFGAQKLDHLAGKVDVSGGWPGVAGDRLNVSLDGNGFTSDIARLDQLSLALAGTRGAHTLKLRARGKVRDAALDMDVDAAGAMTLAKGVAGWRGTINTLTNNGTPKLTLAAPWQVQVDAQHAHLGPAKLVMAAGTLALTNFDYGDGQMKTAGALQSLDVGQVLQLVKTFTGVTPSVTSDMVLDGRWDVRVGQRADGFVEISRRSGDVSLRRGGVNDDVKVTVTGMPDLTPEKGGVAPRVPLGLSTLQARVDLAGQSAHATVKAVSSLVGTLDGDVTAGLKVDRGVPTLPDDGALSGRLALAVPDVSKLGNVLGPQYQLKGRANVQMTLAGTLAKPRPTGQLTADDLAMMMFDTGVSMKDGRVRIALTPDRVTLTDVVFTGGGGGTARATGDVRLDTQEPTLGVTVVADKLQLFNAPDRQLVLSGQAKATGSGEAMAVTGKFTVDRARFDLPPASAPKLGDDVLVVRGGSQARAQAINPKDEAARISARPASSFSPHIDLEIDLGRDFRFSGAGADVRLRGSMHVKSEPLTPLQAFGTINIAEGTYEAFDRKLAIDRGTINFKGPIDNPDLYIQAMRRNQDVAAGVLVTGTVRQPRVTLVSEPTVSDEEKLSWLMFGHAPDGSGLGQQQAIAGAASALLGTSGGKRIVKGLGIDEFSVGTSDSGLPDDEQVVKIGKAISDSFALGYEQSLSSAASIVKVTWQVSRRWQLVLRSGSFSGFDVLFNRRFD